MNSDYKQGWKEGAAALLREIMTKDSGGFIPAERGIKDKNGQNEDWIAVGWVIDTYTKIKDDPQEPRGVK